MLLTDEKIKVTEQMMFDEGMSKAWTMGKIGIPNNALEKEPITWKPLSALTIPDLDMIEDYFLNKKATE